MEQSAVAESVPTRPRRTLSDILASLAAYEAAMESGEVDPSELIGDIRETDDELRDKIDAVAYVIGEYEAFGERMKAKANAYATKARAACNNAERIREYLLVQMRSQRFEQLPGATVRVIRKPSPLSLKITREPTAEDALNDLFRPFVERVPASWIWKKKEVKDALKQNMLAACDFATIERNDYVVFEPLDKPRIRNRSAKQQPVQGAGG